jgi:hypothetical protein
MTRPVVFVVSSVLSRHSAAASYQCARLMLLRGVLRQQRAHCHHRAVNHVGHLHRVSLNLVQVVVLGVPKLEFRLHHFDLVKHFNSPFALFLSLFVGFFILVPQSEKLTFLVSELVKLACTGEASH